MSTAQRSKTGCWTCRLRRKKCNEGGPPCANCESKGIFCHGYGPKPPWKDRGEKEKEQASRLRLQSRRRRSCSKTLSGGNSQQCPARNASIDNSGYNHDMIAPVVHSPSQSDLSLSPLISSQDRQAFELLDNLEMFDSWDALESSNDLLPSSSSAEALVEFNDAQPPTGDRRPDPWDASDFSNEHFLSPSSSRALVGSNDVPPSIVNLRADPFDEPIGFSSAEALNTLADFPSPMGGLQPALLDDPISLSNDTRPSQSSAEASNTMAPFRPPNSDPRPRLAICFPTATTAQASDTDENDIELLMHFIGETFPLQHTSYQAAPMQKSWLLRLLMRSPTFYNASLSISAYHYYLNLSGDTEVRRTTFQAYQKYRAQALTGFYKLLESDRPSTSTSVSVPGECMICGVQIALLEALSKNMQESQSHLNSAAQSLLNNSNSISENHVLSPRVRTTSTSSVPLQLFTPTPSPTVSSTVAVSHPSLMERKAFGFFRAILVWNDILSCSTRKTKPAEVEIYRRLLTDEDFAQHLRDTIGCESWILVAILDATDLETWKQSQEAQGNLSIRELVSRAEKIESILEQGIERMSTVLQGLTPMADTTSNQNNHSDRIQHVQTYIFAHSVLTYLHTIVSGSLPSVPEIQQSVNRAVSAWELFPSVINIKALAWPYCVSASLAVGSQRDMFRRLISEASPREPTLGSLVDLRSVVEECWRGFDERKSERNVLCDWKEVMQRLNLSIIFA